MSEDAISQVASLERGAIRLRKEKDRCDVVCSELAGSTRRQMSAWFRQQVGVSEDKTL